MPEGIYSVNSVHIKMNGKRLGTRRWRRCSALCQPNREGNVGRLPLVTVSTFFLSRCFTASVAIQSTVIPGPVLRAASPFGGTGAALTSFSSSFSAGCDRDDA